MFFRRFDQLSWFLPLALVLWAMTQCKPASSRDDVQTGTGQDTVRFASFNVSMFRDSSNALRNELAGELSDQVRRVCAIIQHVRPDVLALMEFDYDSTGRSLDLLREHGLGTGQFGAEPIQYAYAYAVSSNTGVLSSMDLNGDGVVALPDDAYGFGRHPGQYAFALLSQFPLVEDEIRSFQYFLWNDMPDPKWPALPDGSAYYPDTVWSTLRISSKNHVDIPVRLDGHTVHVILAHPTPPVFDGPEDRNGLRNFDEIRLIRDYIDNASYLVDDRGVSGGMQEHASFVIMGDLNADPVQGNSAEGAIGQLLASPRVDQHVALGDMIPASEGAAARERREGYSGELKNNTSMFGMRIDYVLPSADLEAVASGVFWPAPGDPLHDLVRDGAASDHLCVWVDVLF